MTTFFLFYFEEPLFSWYLNVYEFLWKLILKEIFMKKNVRWINWDWNWIENWTIFFFWKNWILECQTEKIDDRKQRNLVRFKIENLMDKEKEEFSGICINSKEKCLTLRLVCDLTLFNWINKQNYKLIQTDWILNLTLKIKGV